jgi:hypothetical protein
MFIKGFRCFPQSLLKIPGQYFKLGHGRSFTQPSSMLFTNSEVPVKSDGKIVT